MRRIVSSAWLPPILILNHEVHNTTGAMAFTALHCKFCKQSFSAALSQCPGCGRRAPSGRAEFVLKCTALLLLAVALAYAAYVWMNAPS